jgi:hypothetical protein
LPRGSEPFPNLGFKAYAAGRAALTVYTQLLAGFTAVLGIGTIELALTAVRQVSNARLNNRAYVSVDPQGLAPWRGTPGQFLGRVGVHNAGVLPARNLKWTLQIEMTDDGDRSNFPLPAKRRRSQLVVGGATMTRGTRPLAHTEHNYCFVWGIVEYDDGYGKQTCTKFCHRYNTKRADFRSTLAISDRDARQHDFDNEAS